MGRKRKAQEEDAGGEGEIADGEADEFERDAAGLSLYERQRLELIERNRQRMIALGIPAAVTALQQLAPVAKPKPPRKKKERKGPQEPTRHSSRLRGEQAQETADELAWSVINEECPRCGKVLTKGQKQHLAHCSGRPHQRAKAAGDEEEDLAEDEEDEEELAEVQVSEEAERIQRMDDKLNSLQLNGLIELNDLAAKFVVLGSTKNHYIVTLSKDKHTCQCVDFRIRKHQCKHIRLVLTQLDIPNQPSRWRDAVEAKLGQVLHHEGGSPTARPRKQKPKQAAKEEEQPAHKEEHLIDQPIASRAKQSSGRKLPKSMQHS